MLTLLTGPAGSGKTGEIMARLADWRDREPVLVVPTAGDVQRYEDELLYGSGVDVGTRVVTFDRLFALVAAAAGSASQAAGPVGRRLLLAAAARDAGLRVLAASSRRAGFLPALDAFVSQLRAADVPPDAVARGGGPQLAELASVYSAYLALLEELGLADDHSVAADATEALGASPERWQGRPVLVHGFDDLAPDQLGLLAELARTGEVVVSVVHEAGRACLAARTRLVAALEELAAAGVPTERVDLAPRAAAGALGHLERALLQPEPARVAAGGAVAELRAAGERAEVEQVAARVAALLRGGAAPDDVAVILRDPADRADLIEDIFSRYGIPVALQAPLEVDRTPVGVALRSAVEAFLGQGGAPAVLRFLRAARPDDADRVDRLELQIRTERIEEAGEAIAAWGDLGGTELPASRLRTAAAAGNAILAEVAADLAREVSEARYVRRAPILGDLEPRELRAAHVAAEALDEAAALASSDPGLGADAEELVRVVGGLTIPRHRGDAAGRVEVMSPYRSRARQFPHVIVAGLQEGEFPREGRDDPFMGDDQREAVGLPPRAERREEERYLLYVAVTRAVRRLELSYRVSDEEGKPASPSFFVDDVLELLEPDTVERHGRGLGETVFAPEEAPSEHELARALAERGADAVPSGLGAAPALAERLAPRLARGRARADFLPGPLRLPQVLAEVGARRLMGASSLESYAECPFRHFVQHELSPSPLGPQHEPLERGRLMHEALEEAFRALIGRQLDMTNVAEAVGTARRELRSRAAGGPFDPRRPAARPLFRRMEADVVRFLESEATRPIGTVVAVEASFGERDDDERPPLELGELELHGKIDRIDRLSDGTGLVHDYKSSSTVTPKEKLIEERKLQLPLYMLAMREHWGLEPTGGLYHPLGKQHGARPRGLLRGDGPLAPGHLSRTDFTADGEEFEERLEEARALAEEHAREIREGFLDRRPIEDRCPRYCDFHPICRRDRGEKIDREEAEDRAEEAE